MKKSFFCILFIFAVLTAGCAKPAKTVVTQQEAEQLCRDVLGEVAPETGFPLSYNCTGTQTVDGREYYVMTISWYVNGMHWSYISNCFVLCDGSEIYDGFVSYDGCEITGLRWKAAEQ